MRSSWWMVSKKSPSDVRAPASSCRSWRTDSSSCRRRRASARAAASPSRRCVPRAPLPRRPSSPACRAQAEDLQRLRAAQAPRRRWPIWAKRALFITSWPARFINWSSRSMSTRKVSVGLALSAARFFSAPSAAAGPGAAGVSARQSETGSDGSARGRLLPRPGRASVNRSRTTRWTPEIRSRAATSPGVPACRRRSRSAEVRHLVEFAGGGWK